MGLIVFEYILFSCKGNSCEDDCAVGDKLSQEKDLNVIRARWAWGPWAQGQRAPGHMPPLNLILVLGPW